MISLYSCSIEDWEAVILKQERERERERERLENEE